jgi:hypothetical protein
MEIQEIGICGESGVRVSHRVAERNWLSAKTRKEPGFRKQNMLKVRVGGLKGPVSRTSNGKNSNILYF